ncbi:uncharacterized protein F5891DRAFT_1179870 [Suillus fuscotomentosus]|uniref:Uncharacterized protein n=1 Tax=Suillus fuscotomentosus TaxID=1912939 RepID=A0AAD4ELK8_9AGAM|nr:uncharacterized protein F5891DRAFT_1179870 [Suillus fuscotomentosus]KAG1908345.1 hypothetical protein F5891DRAFT_1179870 [Suillus fuscotomentosus]
MPDLTCLGCGKPVPTQKQLSVHGSQCSKNQALNLMSSIFSAKKRQRSNKSGKNSKQIRIEWEEIIEQGMDDQHGALYHQAPMDISDDGVIFEQLEAIAGPSNIPSPSPPPLVTSKCSGRTVCMPQRFIDYLPGSATHLAHMPPTNQQQ